MTSRLDCKKLKSTGHIITHALEAKKIAALVPCRIRSTQTASKDRDAEIVKLAE
ncbi:hypothetical protein Brsp01_35450 [Brucella sp. NBRC 12950]|nr:hypothetical protein Brsp01_35450 [Brucella sp. NBRC 12950]